MKRRFTCLLLSAGLSLGGAASAGPEGVDLHHYWDQRCATCHGHASEFARGTLRVEGDRLRGTHHSDDLDGFLRQHYLSDALLAPVTAMLRAQVTTPPLYARHCARCHDTAAAFARASLSFRGEVLVGRDGGRPVAQLLATHGGLAGGEIATVVSTLARVRREVEPLAAK